MRFLPSATSYPSLPVALLLGDLAAAEHYAEVLLDHSTRYELARWRAVGPDYRAVLVIMRGDLDRGLRLLRANGDEPGEADAAVLRLIAFLMAEALGRTGQIADGLPAVEKALASTERTGERWALAELLRVKGELLSLQGAPGVAVTVEDYFRQALDLARLQGALSWELRAAMSLARLLRHQGRSGGL